VCLLRKKNEEKTGAGNGLHQSRLFHQPNKNFFCVYLKKPFFYSNTQEKRSNYTLRRWKILRRRGVRRKRSDEEINAGSAAHYSIESL
jgi:hypothetical protein